MKQNASINFPHALETQAILEEINNAAELSIGILGLPEVGKSLTSSRLFKNTVLTSRQNPISSGNLGHKLVKVQLGYSKLIFDVFDTRLGLPDTEVESINASLENCDIILWVLDVSKPLSTAEKQSLDMLKVYSHKLIIGLNKIDLMPPCDWNQRYHLPSWQQAQNINEIERHLHQQLNGVFRKIPSIIPYSALYYFGLINLFTAILSMIPDKRWVLENMVEAKSELLIAEYIYSDM